MIACPCPLQNQLLKKLNWQVSTPEFKCKTRSDGGPSELQLAAQNARGHPQRRDEILLWAELRHSELEPSRENVMHDVPVHVG